VDAAALPDLVDIFQQRASVKFQIAEELRVRRRTPGRSRQLTPAIHTPGQLASLQHPQPPGRCFDPARIMLRDLPWLGSKVTMKSPNISNGKMAATSKPKVIR
jgi:hypothetical protein